MNESKNILITGATGLLGSCLTKDLLLAGHKVKAIYRNKERIGQFKKNVSYYHDWRTDLEENLEWIRCDVLDYPGLLNISENIDMVIHSAAMVSFYEPDKKRMYEVNITGTANVVNACLEKKVKKLIHVSSVAALGKTENGAPVNEETPWIPQKKHSAYSISKFHSEMEVWRGINEGLEAIIVNPSIILGPGEWESGSSSFYHQIFKGLKFYTMGKTGFVDVRDVSNAMSLFINDQNWKKGKNQRFLLNAANLVYKDAFQRIANTLGVNSPGIKAGNFILQIAWRAAWLWGKISGSKPQITRNSVVSAASEVEFDGTKITKEFDFQYRNIDETIQEVGQMYLTITGSVPE